MPMNTQVVSLLNVVFSFSLIGIICGIIIGLNKLRIQFGAERKLRAAVVSESENLPWDLNEIKDRIRKLELKDPNTEVLAESMIGYSNFLAHLSDTTVLSDSDVAAISLGLTQPSYSGRSDYLAKLLRETAFSVYDNNLEKKEELKELRG